MPNYFPLVMEDPGNEAVFCKLKIEQAVKSM